MAGKKTGKRLLTWVLVLVMALSLLPLNALAAGGSETDSGSGMIFTKKLVSDVPDKDGNYTIQMTAQATGKEVETTKPVPMDIVLVLDQSGSMADDFNGNSTNNNEARRQYAMKAAVNSFIGEVADKYSTDADHHMAIVTFSDDAETLAGWTAVNSDGADVLTSKISGLPKEPEGATNVGAGMQMAQNLMNNSEAGTDRLKTVIVFTDGVPTKKRDFDTTVADAAIDAAKNMKDAGVTIYTVGIFKGVNPNELYGKDKIGTLGSNEGECSGKKGDYWQYREGFFSGGDIQKADIAAGNRFLNYLSSNYDASEIGITSGGYDGLFVDYRRFTITDDTAKGSNQGYYKTASDASSLKNIFKVISDIVPAPGDPALNKDTVITDTLSDHFTFARTEDGKVDVKVYAKKGNDKREITNEVTVNPDPQTKTVTVTDYDFSAHYTNSNDPQELVIEIKVKPSGEGCASKEIPTNDDDRIHAARVEVEVESEGETETKIVTSHETATVNGYSVEYKIGDDGASWPNNGNGPAMSYYPQDAAVPVTNSVPTRDGYEFIGWTLSTDDTNVTAPAITGGKFTMPAANVTLTAQWTARTDLSYTVNYYWNGEQIQAPTTGDNAMHGDKITITDTSIDGYTLIPGQQTSMTIGTGENVLNLNYYKNVTLTAKSKTETYNGEEQTVEGYTCDTPNVTFEGITARGSGTDAGKYDVTFSANAKNAISTDKLYIVTDTVNGKLEITPRKVTLTSASASKVYDGTPLTKPNVTVTGDGFVEGEVTDIRATGSVTYVSEGEVTNTIEYTPTDKFKADNYDITKTEGKLTITEASAPTPGTFDFNDVVYGDGKDTPAITKTVKGNVGRNFKETFKVTVEPKSDNAKNTMTPDYYTGKAEVIASKSLKDVPFLFKPEAMANAVVPYGELRFTEAGTYTYTVREVPGGTSRMSYDTTEYTLTIKVVLNENANTYQVESWQFTAGNSKYPTPLNIVNTYRTYHPSAPSKPTLNTGDHYAYVMGYPDGTVRPNGSITRAEVSAILFRLLSDKTRDEYFTTESSFTDVKAGAWYNNSIATLEKAGVIVDTAKGGAFRPNEAITRAELAAMLAQFSDAKPVKGVKFSDVSAEHWAYEAIAIAAKMGWIEGYPDGTFRPDATITRAEMMTLVNRALERVPSDEDHLLSKRVMLTFPDCKSGDWFYIAVQEATNSHTYERAATEKNGDEQWTALRANRDWTQLEK